MFKDISNVRFGSLVALTVEGKDNQSALLWKCVCDCGNTTIVRGTCLRYGTTTSCGCVGKKNLLLRETHSMSTTKTYFSYRSMLARCTDPKHKNYARYGGSGIIVCDRWLESFENFYADMGDRPKGKTLDRFPIKDGSYEPSNCRWATKLEQGCNMKNNRFLTYKGETHPLPYWANVLGVTGMWLRNNTFQMNRTIEDLFTLGKLPKPVKVIA